ncbi:hypothetical protein XBKB1_4370004 [Xenorhabdus bovienii str. kraussei Becker Underwood]|uniref:Transposase n=1 Tax=Xenorhabdus bovienii str. kraussei Becker Underwood TaxID=1398204 RepID=A0A077PXV8_XENBV|nr:hypothetical protein XBKB1_4370004 [Xenorhabdus bovienii str. kraussei Becker Underwood]
MAHVFGDRSRKTLETLLALLAPFKIQFYCTDDYAVYDCLPEEKHLRGKNLPSVSKEPISSYILVSKD